MHINSMAGCLLDGMEEHAGKARHAATQGKPLFINYNLGENANIVSSNSMFNL